MLDASHDYDTLRREFRWDIPEFFNIGTATIDAHADGSNRRALIDVGSHRRRAAATLQLGVADAKAAPPIQVVHMPDGSDVAEVRP